MDIPKFQLYFAWGQEKYRLFISTNPRLDLPLLKPEGYESLIALTPPLPIGQAYEFWQRVSTPAERKGQAFPQESLLRKIGQTFGVLQRDKPNKVLAEKQDKLKKLMKDRGLSKFVPDFALQFNKSPINTEQLAKQARSLLETLAGRILLPTEVERLYLEGERSLPENLWEVLQLLFLQGEAEILPGIKQASAGQVCNRCGQSRKLLKINCLDCHTECYHCEECINLGEVKSCLPLIAIPHNAAKARSLEDKLNRKLDHKVTLQLDFSLTKAQADAAREVKAFYKAASLQDPQQTCLVWAVCGAGKTEVSFGAIAEALSRGEKVLFAVPRRDVVVELEPRLKKAFPEISVTALYGGSPNKYADSQLIIATTHQVLRFYQRFSLIVLDEADAYPYQGSEMLRFGLQRTLQRDGKLINMTATPDQELLKEVARGKAKKVTISARHHGYPLPEPRIIIEPSLAKLKTTSSNNSFNKSINDNRTNNPCTDSNNLRLLPEEVLSWLHKRAEGEKGQVFIFVPTIKLVEKVGEVLKVALSQEPYTLPKEWVQYSHSKDPKRDEKREAFKKGTFPFFVTTSIMERGITVPKAKVLVLFADYARIFDIGSLIQMAGRSGRLEADPRGEVLFVAERETETIKKACQAIREMNREAFKKGYLQEELTC